MPIEYVDLAAAEAAAEREADLHSLPELFLENTRLRPHVAAALRRGERALGRDSARRAVLRQSCKTYASSPRIPLPDPRSPRPALPFDAAVAAAMEGDAAFSGAPLTADDLSRLLFQAAGAGAPAGDGARPRAWESVGGAYPLEAYAVVLDVEGIAPGVYHLNAWLHVLEALETADRDDLAARLDSILLEGMPEGVAAAVVTAAIPLRASARYGDRGFRFVLMEAGQVAQALRLGARALGLAARGAPHFHEDRADRLLGLDGVDETALALSLVGRADGKAP